MSCIDSLSKLKILHRMVSIGMLLGALHYGESKAFSSAPIININPSTDVPKPFGGFYEEHGNGMIGWTFQLLVPFTVTQVGWYDKDSDGLSRAFQVGLWEGEGSDAIPGKPRFPGSHYPSLIGNPDSGLIIPAGTNASLSGVWRVVDLPEPLTLKPGFYQLGGLDSSNTTDVIVYVEGSVPGNSRLTPPGSPLIIGPFFYAWLNRHEEQVQFGPTDNYYLFWGLELGPMLFGTKASLPSTESGLSIRRLTVEPVQLLGVRILLIWPVGSLLHADRVTGPYTPVTNAASPYIVPSSSSQKFFRLAP